MSDPSLRCFFCIRHIRTWKCTCSTAEVGVLIFQKGLHISVIFGLGGPNILGVHISRDRPIPALITMGWFLYEGLGRNPQIILPSLYVSTLQIQQLHDPYSPAVQQQAVWLQQWHLPFVGGQLSGKRQVAAGSQAEAGSRVEEVGKHHQNMVEDLRQSIPYDTSMICTQFLYRASSPGIKIIVHLTVTYFAKVASLRWTYFVSTIWYFSAVERA